MGFDKDEAMLQNTPRSFDGYRILQEYFAFPERYLFIELNGLSPLISQYDGDELELFVMLDRSDSHLVNALDKANLALFCVPAINLFPKRTDRLNIDHRQSEYHVVIDRTRPMDYEVFSLTQVAGYGNEQKSEQAFLPFYGSKNAYQNQSESAFYMIRRQKRVLSTKQRRVGVRSSYIGSEMYISLVDAEQAPYSPNLIQLGMEALCTNRDLPLVMPVGLSDTDFTLPSAVLSALPAPCPPPMMEKAYGDW
jgi:type VI secretion system protein ImpG